MPPGIGGAPVLNIATPIRTFDFGTCRPGLAVRLPLDVANNGNMPFQFVVCPESLNVGFGDVLMFVLFCSFLCCFYVVFRVFFGLLICSFGYFWFVLGFTHTFLHPPPPPLGVCPEFFSAFFFFFFFFLVLDFFVFD